MSGVVVIRHLLANNADWVALLPAARTLGGPLPQGTDLPAASITLVDGMDFKTIKRGSSRFVTERVQVSVLAEDYDSIITIMKVIPRACPNTRGTVNGVLVDSITLETESGDGSDELIGQYFRSRDLMVKYWDT